MEMFLEGVWEPTKERLQSCYEELGRISSMIADLEKLRQVEDEQLILEQDQVDLLKLTRNMCRTFDPELQKKALGDEEPITCRPADLIPDELDTLRKECAQWIQQDEDVLTYALFPQVAVDFFKYRQAQQTKVDATVADTENGSYPV